MKAPDKIYIPLYPNHSLDGVHLGDDYMYEPQKECDNVEYIRKDVLLEWAKELKLLLKDKSGAQYEGAEVVVNGIIDKIESL